MRPRRAWVPALWLGMVALGVLLVARARYVTDLSAFLPAHPNPLQQLLVDQLQQGPASRLILMAIANGDAPARAAVSAAMAKRLRLDPGFAGVDNGESVTADRDRDLLFQHRYLLSAAVTPQRFTAAGLKAAIQDTIEGLGSSAGPLLKSLAPHDPTGEMLQVLDGLSRTPGPQTRDGVWVSADHERAVLVAETRAPGSDTDAQERAQAAIRAAFDDAVRKTPRGAMQNLRLQMSGPGIFAVAARAKIERAAVGLSIVSSVLIIVLLLAVYRSAPALILGLLPVATGALAGIAAVALGFGAVHGVTLGFGITLIGEAVDYSIYFFIQSRRARPGADESEAWRRLVWPTVRLGVLTSLCGFASLLPSGFPGLAQLGLYSISGLIAAALVTRHVLPELLPRGFAIRDVSPLGCRLERLLTPVARLGRTWITAFTLAVAALASFTIYQHRATLWNRELSALSPISSEDLKADAKLRADLGAADARDLVIVSGPDLQSVLRGAELAGTALQQLTDAAVIGGFDSPATYLPSLATQAMRRSSLPEPQQLRSNLQSATADLNVHGEQLSPFLDDVEAARRGPLLEAEDLKGTSLARGFDALILHQEHRWNALLPLHALSGAGAPEDIDVPRIAAALSAAHVGDARVLDLKLESDALYASYLNEAIRSSVAGFAAIVALLLIVLRSPGRVARVLAPLGVAVLSVAAMLALARVQLTILHLVGMLLTVAVGSNYALFFDRHAQNVNAGGVRLTLASLLIANASTVIGFGLLSFSQVPVLAALGTTVAPGAMLALLFAALLAPPGRDADRAQGVTAPRFAIDGR